MKKFAEPGTYGIFRLAAAVPVLKVADVNFNSSQILELYRECAAKKAALVLFPELSVTGRSCGDLFLQPRLLNAAKEALLSLAGETGDTVLVCGAPLTIGSKVYDTMFTMQNGRILGAVPRSGCDRSLNEFAPGAGCKTDTVLDSVPFGTDLIFDAGVMKFAFETGADLWSVMPPAGKMALNGANVILTPSAEIELADGANVRRQQLQSRSRSLTAAYLCATAGVHESTADSVCAGHALAVYNGSVIAENRRFERNANAVFADIDLARTDHLRRTGNFAGCEAAEDCRIIHLAPAKSAGDLQYFVNPPMPFVPEKAEELSFRCDEIFNIQCSGLIKRVEHSRAKSIVLGISGGLDSTLALLTASECCKRMNRPATDVIAVTMPGFGTTGRTYNNAVGLCKALGVTLMEISIKEACLRHFADIGHDENCRDVTYENAQARERTQILMDLSNKYGGFVLGTGDLSEIALGWCTYNGDHMSMYAVNATVPKTLMRSLIEHIAGMSDSNTAAILRDVVATPVSPELLPPDDSGKIGQKTENLLGPYELHDYYLYALVRYGAEPEKIEYLANHAFAGKYPPEEIHRCLALFLRRFFQQQFKRSCMPDGPKTGSAAISSKGDWRMPSDVSGALWTL